MTSIKLRNVGLAVTIMALLLIAPLSSVAAQQEEPIGADRGVNVIAGPHAVRVVVINSNLAAGFLQIALFITDSNTRETVSDARVILKANNDGQGYEGWGTAHNSPANPQRYDARMNLGSTGEWTIDVDVKSSLGQGATNALTLEVPALNRYTDGSLVFFGIFAVMMLGVIYIICSVKRDNRRRRLAEESSTQADS
ncbi:MAG: hypothetical protein FI711_09590 [SAR202 cluster bacterium]|jgi:hypothetical protein|nr:hypothetical protein [Dehalococcoidia bacterium]MQG49667.1 hypothetical protein [SAR202 cluster bacterium]MQG78420.1 hypothetical protein [SAR202 cluster bacterium]|tara:strand:+ start:1543 stop:2130 length:588 start_codon:yes stop_codon:yes gene_type:complete